jgi:hypothetical protein
MNTIFDFVSPHVLDRKERLCYGRTEEMYPEDRAGVLHAIEICKQCSNRAPCLESAIEHGEIYGVWGGTSERARVKLIKASRSSRPIDHT